MAGSAQNIIKYIPHLRRYAFALTYNADEAEDLVQESLARSISKCPSWDKIKRPRAYLFSIMHNLHIDRRKKAKSQANMMELEKMAARHAVLTDPALAYDFNRALQRIHPNQREIILFIGVHGFTYGETAAILGVPVGTVMSRLSRARRALRKHLDNRTKY